MKCALLVLAALLGCHPQARAQAQWPQSDETLSYSVQWPSGLELGEAQMQAKKVKAAAGAEDKWDLQFTLNAAVPGFTVKDRYHSLTTSELCSIAFDKESLHGKRVVSEATTFDQQTGSATRETKGGGGKSELRIPQCARDALSFLYFLRGELGQGRLPPAQTVFFGSPYQVRFEYGGRQRLTIGGEQVEADRMTASAKGPASEITFEFFVSLDPARRLVLARVPLPLGLFSMELVP